MLDKNEIKKLLFQKKFSKIIFLIESNFKEKSSKIFSKFFNNLCNLIKYIKL